MLENCSTWRRSDWLCGFGDPAIDSNDKNWNANQSVLEFLHQQTGFASRVAAFASWDVLPFILNHPRSRIAVTAGWDRLDLNGLTPHLSALDRVAAELPKLWPSVRYDTFTTQAAVHHLQTAHPRVLYVALGETDDWAHEGRYDLYLDAARRNDQYLRLTN